MKIRRTLSLAAMCMCAAFGMSAATLTQCPAGNIAGSDYTGCNFLITQNADGSYTTTVDSTQPFFGGEDNYAGFQNNTSHSVSSLVIDGHGTDLFAFDGDGPTPITTSAPTGYEGPNNTFTNISSDMTVGTVNFTKPIAPGASTYFFLEEAISATAPPTGGGGGGGSVTPEPATLSLMGTSLLGLAAYAWRRKRA